MRVAWILLALLGLAACSPPPPAEPPGPAALFVRHWARPIYPQDVPTHAERDAPLHLQAAPGEREPASLGLRALVLLSAVDIRVSDLLGPDGARVPATAIEVRLTRYVEPYNRWRPVEGKPLLPGWLDRAAPFDVAARTTRQIWLTVAVPHDARPGTYRGTVDVSAATGLGTVLSRPLTLQVVPVALAEPTPAYFLYRDTDPDDGAQLKNSRAHGMNTVAISPRWLEAYDRRFDAARQVITQARTHGLAVDRPVVTVMYWHLAETIPRALADLGIRDPLVESWGGVLDYDHGYRVFFDGAESLVDVPRHRPWRPSHPKEPWSYWPVPDPRAAPTTAYGRRVIEEWEGALRAFDQMAQQEGWPQPWHYLIDEPHHSRGAMRLALMMLRAAESARATAFITCNEPSVSEPRERARWFSEVGGEPALVLEPELDVRAYASKYLGPATRTRTRDAGDRYATYVNIYANEPQAVRYQTGLLAWKLGLDAVMLWAWHHGSVPDGDARAFLRDWEAVREGIDDLRYAEALERALREERGDAGAREHARAVLERLRDAIEDDVAAVGHVDAETGAFVAGRDALGPEALDRWRAELAAAWMALAGSYSAEDRDLPPAGTRP